MASDNGTAFGAARTRRASNPYYGTNNERVLQQIDSKVLTNTLHRPSQPEVSKLSQAQQIADRGGPGTLPPVSHESQAGGWNFRFSERALADELQSLLSSLKRCLELRADYMAWSLQRIGDNPKDSDSWDVFPPPPPSSYVKSETGDVKLDTLERRPPPEFDMSKVSIPEPDTKTFAMCDDGVYKVFESDGDFLRDQDSCVFHVPSVKDYYVKLDFILEVISDGPTKSFAFRRMRYLESKFQMYTLLNDYQEMAASKRVPHRDFYNVRKVDTHVHHSSCMNQKHLLRFIKSKLRKSGDVGFETAAPLQHLDVPHAQEIVIFRDNKHLTLNEVFQSLNLTAYDLSIDTLDMHAHKDSFHRFDKFNLKYNPLGESRLREIFLKTDNFIKGKYLAELTKEVFQDLEASKYQHAEYRISIYGRSKSEWSKLAAWVVDNKLFSTNVRWLIQIPRLYNVYKESGQVKDFAEVIANVFEPLYAATKDPSVDPKLHVFLQNVIGFDSVDDESKPEKRIWRKYPLPKQWNFATNPPYSYWAYFLYANMVSLNHWRQQRGFNTFVFRPHAGEAGDTEHLAAAYLTSQSISHGILLRKVPALQYLYYLDQIGIAMSPLSNNALFLEFERNPFLQFFQRGLNVSLSTDDPLQFHFTKEPLIEEYSVAAQIWKLSPTDMCEIARNSVMQSGWELGMKKRWLGDDCAIPGPTGNDIHKTNVPDLRVVYRWETLTEERQLVLEGIMRLPHESVAGDAGDHPTYVEEAGLEGTRPETLVPQVALTMNRAPSPTIRIPVELPPRDSSHGLGRAASTLDAELADEEVEVEQRRRSRSVEPRSDSSLGLVQLNISPPAFSTPASPTKTAPRTVDEIKIVSPTSPLKRNPSISMAPSTYGVQEDGPNFALKSAGARMSIPAIFAPGLASKGSMSGLLEPDDDDNSVLEQDL
ncbi:hypothetical protein DFJ74DRAFT_354560 [Hyaloraphidium curvatum]|nr:hypothetical protein DFJ74DRAFT_354560 [Hyaloraphidium curvatum]